MVENRVRDASLEQLVEFAQPRDRAVEDRDFGAEPNCHPRRMGADDPAAEHHDARRNHARHAAEQNAAAAELRFKAEPAASIESLPATSLMGASSGRPPLASVTVS